MHTAHSCGLFMYISLSYSYISISFSLFIWFSHDMCIYLIVFFSFKHVDVFLVLLLYYLVIASMMVAKTTPYTKFTKKI